MSERKKIENTKVVRVSKKALRLIKAYRDDEHWSLSKALDRALDVHGHEVQGWILPSQLYRTRKEAREDALRDAAREGLELDEAETPVKVRGI